MGAEKPGPTVFIRNKYDAFKYWLMQRHNALLLLRLMKARPRVDSWWPHKQSAPPTPRGRAAAAVCPSPRLPPSAAAVPPASW